MDISDKEYKKYKLQIKIWEHKFKKRESRVPSKDDIKTAPDSVKEAYKRYWLAKTSILEKAILDEEEIENVNNSNFSSKTSNQSMRSVDDSLAEEIIPKTICDRLQTENISSNESERLSKTNFFNKDTVWGSHLKKADVKNKASKIRRSSSFEYTRKLFEGIKMKKKSIRKSINLAEQPKSVSTELCSVNPEPSASELDTNSQDAETKEDGKITAFSLNDVNVRSGKTIVSIRPVNINHYLDNFTNVRSLVKSNLNKGWLERCQQKCGLSLSHYEEQSSYLQKDDENFEDSSSDDYIYSDDENTTKVKNEFSQQVDKIESVVSCASNDSLEVQTVQLVTNIKTNEECNLEPHSNLETLTNKLQDEFPLLPNRKIDSEGLTKLKKRGHIIKSNEKKRIGDEILKPTKKQKTYQNSDDSHEKKLKLLQQKVESGKANENYVRIDLKHKRYSRGKKTITTTKYKINQWKIKKKMSNSASSLGNGDSVVLKCFRCGDTGHFMRQCKKKDVLLPLEECDEVEDSPFPTLEEAEQMVQENSRNLKKPKVEWVLETINELEQPEPEDSNFIKTVPPLYQCNENGTVPNTPDEVFEALHKFGYENFRGRQEKAIMRILSGKSTVVISGTGSGKSLCYQLPAYLYTQKYRCISLVISPLVSLMEDQVINFPASMKGACLHTNQTITAREKIIKKIENDEISVLLISPEAMVSGERGILGRALTKNFPPVAFVCIDEVHCVSQWSYNFRTSYLMICKILRERFNIRTFLGLTATASRSSISCIADHLGVSNDPVGVLQESVLPKNLILSVSKDEFKDNALLTLLKRPPFSDYKSIIIYCLRRNECERLASFLRTALQDFQKPLPMFGDRTELSTSVEVYHAGLTAGRRKKIQNNFMKGKLRIVIATVAFGMGINKADIRGIIHYNMPRTFEHYVQEIGRAGRDGLPARCHMFYDPQNRDAPELKRHIYRDSLDRSTIRKLLENVFPQCSCSSTCSKHEIAFSVDTAVRSLDLPQENISTLLCYLQLLPEHIVEVLPPAYIMCKITSYQGVMALQRAAKNCPPLAYVIAEHTNKTNTNIPTQLEFSVMELADKIGWESGVIKSELKRCEWIQVDSKWKKTGIGVTFYDLGFHVRSPGNLNENQLDFALDALYNRTISQERMALHQLNSCSSAFESVAYASIEETLTSQDLLKRDGDLKGSVSCYFDEGNQSCDYKPVEAKLQDEENIIISIHRLISSYKDCTFTGRAIARIFHGIESPNFPAVIWGRSPFWRCGLNEDFNALCRVACRELIKIK